MAMKLKDSDDSKEVRVRSASGDRTSEVRHKYQIVPTSYFRNCVSQSPRSWRPIARTVGLPPD